MPLSLVCCLSDPETLHYVCSYGHGVLRSPDPRFIALQEFCETRPQLLADPVIQLVKKVHISLFRLHKVLINTYIFIMTRLMRLLPVF